MARSGVQELIGRLLPGRTAVDGNLTQHSDSSTALAATAGPTIAGPSSPSPHDDLRVPSDDGTTSRSAPEPTARIVLLERQRDTGSAAEQLSAEYELQTLTHLARFSSLLDRVRNARREREVHVEEEYNATQSEFAAALAVREKETLELREMLERTEDCGRQRLRDRVLQQCIQHDDRARRGLESCTRFAGTVLANEVQISLDTLDRVKSSDFPFWTKPNSVDTRNRTRLRTWAREALKPDHKWAPVVLFVERQGPEHKVPAYEATSESADLREHETEPSTPPPSARLEEESPVPSLAEGILHTDSGLLEAFDIHFSVVGTSREAQWRHLQDECDSDLRLWRERFHALLASLGKAYSSEATPVRAENALKAADEFDRASAQETFSNSEYWRAHDLERLWQETKVAFTLHHDRFVSKVPNSAFWHESANHYSPHMLRPIAPRGPQTWVPVAQESPGIIAPLTYTPIHPPFSPHFSLSRLLRAPGVAKALPTTSSRTQMRVAFRDAQALRDRQFEGTMVAFEAEFNDAQRKQTSLLELELRSWRVQATAAERERRAVFASRMQTAREEWGVYRVRRAQDEHDLMRKFEEEFSRSQAGREERFMLCVQKMHDHFMGVVQELLDM